MVDAAQCQALQARIDKLERRTEKLGEQAVREERGLLAEITCIKVDVAKLKTSQGMWAGVAAGIPTLAIVLLRMLG
jgi:hypothetical protein